MEAVYNDLNYTRHVLQEKIKSAIERVITRGGDPATVARAVAFVYSSDPLPAPYDYADNGYLITDPDYFITQEQVVELRKLGVGVAEVGGSSSDIIISVLKV